MLDLDTLDFAKGNGLVTVVTQSARTGQLLMTAFADREALERTLATGEMHYRSRTRQLWHKGATSGAIQRVVSLVADCDADAVLARVEPAGPACHTGAVSCFAGAGGDVLSHVDAVIAERQRAMAEAGGQPSYTQRLLADRNLRLKKLGEEAVELATACVEENTGRAIEEAADLIYHALVAVRATGGTLDDVRAALAARTR